MMEKTASKKRRKYDSVFKEEVLNMVSNGRPVGEVAQALGIGENLIYKWKSRSAAKKKDCAGVIAADGNREEALTRRIRELETERDILKKALAIFSRQI